MATLTLAVDGVGANDLWTNFGGADKAASVASPDDDNTSYVTDSIGAVQDLTFANASLPAGAVIISVEIVCRNLVGIASESPPSMQLFVGASSNAAVDLNNTAGYANTSPGAYTTAPDGSSWDATDLDGIFVRLANTTLATNVRVTTLYANVTYRAPSGNLPLVGAG